MPLNPYAPCPCGSGEKFKFCCSDLAHEMEKIERMIEGEQFTACLEYIRTLTARNPDRASLLGIQAMLESALGQLDAAQATLAHFLAKHPNNPVAWAETAILNVRQGKVDEAADALQSALEPIDVNMPLRVYEAVGLVGRALIESGNVLAGMAHLLVATSVENARDEYASLLMELNMSSDIPLLLKETRQLNAAPQGQPWTQAFETAHEQAAKLRWRKAAAEFAALCEPSGDAPEVWCNLALLRSWIGDVAGAIEALRKYATLDIPLEDAVEAAALAQLIDPEALGAELSEIKITHPIQSLDDLMTRLISSTQTFNLPLDAESFDPEWGPPPRAVYLVLDRPLPKSSENLKVEDVPLVLGQAFVYGRETDREPRLELLGTQGDVDRAKELLTQTAGDALGEVEAQEEIGKSDRQEYSMHWAWHFPADTPPLERTRLHREKSRDMLLNVWPTRPLPVLHGKTPAEAASDPQLRIQVLGAILLFELSPETQTGVNFNELRTKLGLPTLEPIEAPDEQPDAPTATLPRMHRVVAKTLSDKLLLAYHRLAFFRMARKAMLNFATEIVARDSIKAREERVAAYGALINAQEDRAQAIELVEQARREAELAGESSVSWDLAELQLSIMHQDSTGAQRLLMHIQQDHIKEPGVAEQLYRLLMRFGVIRPDGVPAGPPPADVAPPAADSGGLWTPGGDAPAETGGGSKLWVPGMD